MFYICFGDTLAKNRRLLLYNRKIRRMSVTVSDWKQICDAPTNNSCSKMAYSFPKAPFSQPDK